MFFDEIWMNEIIIKGVKVGRIKQGDVICVAHFENTIISLVKLELIMWIKTPFLVLNLKNFKLLP